MSTKRKITKFIVIGSLLAFIFNLFCLFSVSAETGKARYCGYANSIMPYAAVNTETVNYTKKEATYVETEKAVPVYTQISSLENSCGPTGGAIIVGFYDKYYENLIPDYVSYYAKSGTYKRNDKVVIPQLMSELYTLMRTNVDDVGVSQPDCLNGLNTYVTNHGYSLTYTNVKSSNTINETSYLAAINANQPTLIFCSKMDLYMFGVNDNYDTLVCSSYTGGHIIVGYGLYTVKYFNGDTNFRTDTYLKVATGMSELSTGYIRIDAADWCNAAYAVNIS